MALLQYFLDFRLSGILVKGTLPDIVTAPGNGVRLNFRTDFVITRRGFRATFTRFDGK